MSFTLSTIASDKVRRYSRANLRRRLEGDGFAVPRASVWINARESLTLRRKSEITGDGGVARDIEPVRAERPGLHAGRSNRPSFRLPVR